MFILSFLVKDFCARIFRNVFAIKERRGSCDSSLYRKHRSEMVIGINSLEIITPVFSYIERYLKTQYICKDHF